MFILIRVYHNMVVMTDDGVGDDGDDDGDDVMAPGDHAVEGGDDGDGDDGNRGDPNTCCNSGWVDS